jgi:hypothetical protein
VRHPEETVSTDMKWAHIGAWVFGVTYVVLFFKGFDVLVVNGYSLGMVNTFFVLRIGSLIVCSLCIIYWRITKKRDSGV